MEVSSDNALGDGIGFVKLIDSMGNDISIVNAARVSFGKRIDTILDKDRKLIQYLLREKHSSPFEHVTFTFHVKTPLFVARQWMRHRTQSYNEISRRYTSENIEFYIPNEYRKQDKNDRQASDVLVGFNNQTNNEFKTFFSTLSNTSLEAYKYMIQAGMAREMARMLLPQNMYTEFYTTVNLWNLFHFIQLRKSNHAQLEIRAYAELMEILIQDTVPVALDAWKNLNKKE